MSCGRSRKGSRLSSRLTRTYALLFAATTLVLSLCVYLVSRRFLIGRRQDELVSASQNIAEIFCEELPDGGEGLADCRQADGRHLLMYRKNVLMPGDEAAVLAVQAGNDLLCSTDYAEQYNAVLSAVLDGRIDFDALNASVTSCASRG